MLLAINVNNSNITFGLASEEGKFITTFKIASSKNQTEFDYAIKVKQLFDLGGIDIKTVKAAIIACVVPTLTDKIRDAVKLLFNVEPLIVGSGIKTGLHIVVDDPGTVGPDLVVSACACKAEYKLPCIIIDMGFATTITVVDKSGKYIGGAIMPGMELSLNALSQGAAMLSHTNLMAPSKVISSNTQDSMRAGIIYGNAGAVDGIVDRFKEALKTDEVTIVATGNFANEILPYVKHDIVFDEDLMLKGLYYVWKKNM